VRPREDSDFHFDDVELTFKDGQQIRLEGPPRVPDDKDRTKRDEFIEAIRAGSPRLSIELTPATPYLGQYA
jgi:hypothetical protein